jgi:hypothetical protein
MAKVLIRIHDLLCENVDTTGFSRVVFQFNWRAKQQRFLDTTDFSRVEVQFLPNFAPPKKAEPETPRD